MNDMQKNFTFKEGEIYMCGHSLGPQPKQAVESVNECLKDWAIDAIASWNKADWIHLPYKLGRIIADIIGAKEDEVIVTDSTSINLFKVLYSALRINSKRNVIMTVKDNFPADLYIMQGVENLSKIELRYTSEDQMLEDLKEDVAVLMLTHVNYRTGLLYEIKVITERAHELGIIVIWDLSHSVGVVPLALADTDIDFAIGCTYKYLNGGPGSPSFIYANRKHHKNIFNPIYGWMGHKAPFDFSNKFEGTVGVGSYLSGTPFILSMKALEGALRLFENVSLKTLYEETIKNGNYLIELLSQKVPEIVCISPKDFGKRGGHIAFHHTEAYAITRALITEGLICDYRDPHLIRLGVTSLYLNLEDMKRAFLIIEKVVHDRYYQRAEFQKKLFVT